jgi:pimeloyl-ACP methyl ester carboxylesterase
MNVIEHAGHCAHDEAPNEVNLVLTKLIEESIGE